MKFRINFDKLHRSKKHAYTDGFLTGSAITFIVWALWSERQDVKRFNDVNPWLEEDNQVPPVVPHQ